MRLRSQGAAVMAAAALTVTAFTPATAEATAPNAVATKHPGYRAMAPLPPIGQQIPTSLLAINSPFSYKGGYLSMDLRGSMNTRIDVNPADPYNSVRTTTTAFRVSGESEALSIVLELSGDTAPDSTLTATQNFPPKYEERDYIPLKATLTDPDGTHTVLESKEPMVLLGTITQFPPKGDLYRLEKPVDFVDPAHPDTIVATLQKFPTKRGGL